MMRFVSKTIRLGKLTISIIPYEVVFLYIGASKIYIKTLRFNRDFPFKKASLYLAGGVAATILISVIISLTGRSGDSNDDEIKQNILNTSHFTTPAPNEQLVIKEHKVKRGETLSGIAHKYGVSMDTISGSNNLKSQDSISEGLLLKIPNKDGLLQKVSKGTSIVELASTYRVSLKKIIEQNNIKNPDFISVGTTIFIPDAKPQNMVAGFIWPTKSRFITCGYGWRRNPYNWKEREFHMGLDIRASYEWIRSAKYGQVSFTGWLGGYGKAIIITHPGGWQTVYAHLSRIIVKNGQYVKQGQTIGMSGNTGRSIGAHLHFEIINKGKHLNPYRFLVRRK